MRRLKAWMAGTSPAMTGEYKVTTASAHEDLCFTPATELAARIRRKQLSPVELVQALLARIERLQPALNAYTVVYPELALAAAKRAESEVVAGGELGPLHGVPFSVKDMIASEGMRLTYGSYIFETNVADRDAVAVQRLKAAGAIAIGMTAMGEFGHKGFNDSPLWGVTRNPWKLDRTTGGSSGGAAATIAAGMGPLAIGTDYAGSVRIPAACCGIVGLKGTLGAVPYDAALEVFGGMLHVGSMARTVGDTALMMSAMMGPHPSDPYSYGATGTERVAAAAAQPGVRGKRVAWMPKVGNLSLDPDVASATRETVNLLQQNGAAVEEIEVDLRVSADIIFAVTPAAFYAQYGARLPEFAEKLDPTFRMVIEAGARGLAHEHQTALILRTALYRQVQKLFERFDLLVMPTLAAPALPATHKAFDELTIGNVAAGTPRYAWYPYTHPFNITGHPAMSVPVGFSREDLPIGLQLVGPWHAEDELIRVAALIEKQRPWAERRPKV
jgi:aspartyl-tRNA(Asn)/glutamyl-tRNA(Gln) amidotransferase subunit A